MSVGVVLHCLSYQMLIIVNIFYDKVFVRLRSQTTVQLVYCLLLQRRYSLCGSKFLAVVKKLQYCGEALALGNLLVKLGSNTRRLTFSIFWELQYSCS